MRIHIVQHVPFETPGAILEWAQTHQHDVQIVVPSEGQGLPTVNETDFLILLGGPMSVQDESQYPWLKNEKKALKEFIKADKKPLLGICLGAQLIAESLGGTVSENSQKEIGWFEVQFQNASVFKNTYPMVVFHWHGEMFDLPPATRLLASSAATPVQAFSYGNYTVALQFHPEVNESSLNALIQECGHLIDTTKKSEQGAKKILAQSQLHLKRNRALLDQILNDLINR